MNSLDRNTPILTIGIPTFNRSESVCARLKELIALEISDQIEILVIDNHSSDGTTENLNEITIPSHLISNIQIISNESNLGFVGNFFTLFDHCRSEYLLVCSDEDQVLETGLKHLLDLLVEKSPDFVSPQAEINGKLFRGRKKTLKLDYLQHQGASFYLSGLCFKTKSAKKFLTLLPNLVNQNALVDVYPQTALAGCLVAEGSGFWLGAMVTRQLDELPSHIAQSDGSVYHHLNGRYQQIKGSLFLADLMITNGHLTRESLDSIVDYKKMLHRQVFRRLRTAINDESPEIARNFDKGARRYYLFSWFTEFYGNKSGSKVGQLIPRPIKAFLAKFL